MFRRWLIGASLAVSFVTITEAGAEPPIGGATSANRAAAGGLRVLFITAQDCQQCQRDLTRLQQPDADFETLRKAGWKIGAEPTNHIQIVDRESIPELVSQLNVREFPVVVCIEDGKIIRSFKDGCTTPLDLWTFGWLLKGENERPAAAVAEPARAASTGHYRLRGNHWSVDGDWNPTAETVARHLRSSNHAHRITADWQLEIWSVEELRSLHDDLHDSEPIAASPANFNNSGRTSNSFSASRKAGG